MRFLDGEYLPGNRDWPWNVLRYAECECRGRLVCLKTGDHPWFSLLTHADNSHTPGPGLDWLASHGFQKTTVSHLCRLNSVVLAGNETTHLCDSTSLFMDAAFPCYS